MKIGTLKKLLEKERNKTKTWKEIAKEFSRLYWDLRRRIYYD